jgi:hypothetical protein
MTKMKVVSVGWLDAASLNGWSGGASATGRLMPCTTVGLLSHKDAKRVTVIQNVSEDGDVDGVMSIPTPTISQFKVVGHCVVKIQKCAHHTHDD